MGRKKIKVRPHVANITFKLHGDNTECCIYGINNSITHKDLVDLVFEKYPNFTGWISIGNIKIKFKNGELHASHNSPAIRNTKVIRVFIENGILQTYRKHDGIISELVNFTLTAYHPKSISVYDIFDSEGNINFTDFFIKSFNHDNFPVARHHALGDYYFFEGFDKIVSEFEVMQFKEKNNIDTMNKSDIDVLMFEVSMERARL
jgi:hypothetical protein